MLELAGLTKRYGDVVALDECTLKVERGQMLGFLGPNGAGKTTAMRSIFGLVALDSGGVTWEGSQIGKREKLGFGYMPEERGLYPRMTALDQVVYFGRLHGMTPDGARDAAVELLGELGLGGRLDTRVQSLSHGNQQRVQLAVALVHSPQLLVLDEPFSGLDPVAAETMAVVLQGRATAGSAVVFSSHQLDVVEDLCRDVVIINDGRIVLDGRVDDLRAASAHRRVEIVVRGAEPDWHLSLGLPVEVVDGQRVRLVVAHDTDPAPLLDAARRAGEVVEFAFSPPPLSEVFREAVAP